MKTTWWLLLAVAGFVVLSPHQAQASSCTASRFHFINNIGCDQRNGGAGGVPAAQCPDCPGMPRWWVPEPYVNLEMSDEPLSYVMSSSKKMSFKWFYDQHYEAPKVDEIPNWFYYIGANQYARPDYYAVARTTGMTNAAWAHNWMMNIEFWDAHWESLWTHFGSLYYPPTSPPVFSAGYEALLFRPEGGMNYFYSPSGGTPAQDSESQIRLQPLSTYPIATNQPHADTNGIYWGDANMGFKLIHPDGSQDIFNLTFQTVPSPNLFGGGGSSSAYALLTQQIDPQGRTSLVGYEYVLYTNYWTCNRNAEYTGFRVKYVVDPDGRTNTFYYNTNAPTGYASSKCCIEDTTNLVLSALPPRTAWELTEVDDPYGRNVKFTHDYLSGILTGIIDAVGLTNSFQYIAATITNNSYLLPDPLNLHGGGGTFPTSIVGLGTSSGWITNLSTPYGNTSFGYYEVPDASLPDAYQQRAIYVSEPEGAKQLYFYLHNASSLMATTATKPTVPGHTDFDDGNSGTNHPTLNYRNTVQWGRRQFTALSSGVQSYLASGSFSNALYNLTAADFKKGRTRNWLWQPDGVSLSDALASEQDPSPDTAGSVAGLRTWYGYAGKPSPEVTGSNPQVNCIARLLPDGSSQYTIYNYYSSGSPGAGLASDNESTYSKSDGSIGLVTNWFGYAANNIDLTSISNSAGQFVNLGYTNHALTGITNALNQVTTLTWDAGITWNLTGIQFASGESVAMNVDHSGSFVGGVFVRGSKFGFATHPTWSPSGRAFTFNTYSAGLPTSVTDDRGLTVANTWDGLNRLTGTSFPDNTTISNVYSRLDLVASKDRLDHWTYYGFDGLQHLTAVTNANNAVTSYSWCGCGSLTAILDALTNLTTLSYDNQGNLTGVSFPDFSSLTYQFDLARRMTYASDGAGRYLQLAYNIQGLVKTVTGANGTLQSAIYDAVNRPISITDANGVTVTNQFDGINELLKRTWPDGIGESYGYSTNGLAAYTNRDQKVTRFLRDGARRLTAVTNANTEVTQFGYDSLNNVTSLIDGLLHQTTWQFNEYGWLTNKIDGLTRNVFRYAYNPNGWVTNRWMPEKGNTGYTFDNVGNLKSIVYPSSTITYAYNLLNELTNMVDTVGAHNFSWTPTGQLQSEDGPWASDTVSDSYAQGLRTALALSQPSGSWSQSYGFDSGWRMTSLVSPAGSFGYGYNFQPASKLVTSIRLPNGAIITNRFDTLARLKETDLNNYWGRTLDGYTYTLDPLGLRTNIVRNLGLSSSGVNVGYDNILQLTSWSASETGGMLRQNEQLGFGYDAAHNLHTRNNGNLAQTFTTDAANQLNSVTRSGTFTLNGATPAPATSVTVNGNAAQIYGDFTFARTNITLANGNNTFTNVAQNTYGVTVTNTFTVSLPASVTLTSDSNGNLTNDGVKVLSYDAENQLTNVTVPNNFKKDFVYDGLNRLRIKREFGWIGSAWVKTNEVRFIWDCNVIVQLRDSNNVPTLTLTRGLDSSGSLQGAGGIGGILAMTESTGANSYFHGDGLGNVTALLDANENVVARRMFDGLGRTINLTGSKAGVNPFWASSQLHDEALDMDSYLYRNLFRGIQRWSSPDPAGLTGGINQYGFVRNNPLRLIDPDGKAPQVTGVSFDPNGGNSSVQYQDQQFGQGYGIGSHTPEGSPLDMLNAYNDWQDGQNQQMAQQIADLFGQGNDPQTVSDIYDQLSMVSMMGVPESDLGNLGKIKCPPKMFPKLGWSNSKPYKDALNKIRQGGQKVDLGFTPTQQQALQLLNDAGVDMSKIRMEPPHAPPNPHDYPHINYPTPGGGKGTIGIQ